MKNTILLFIFVIFISSILFADSAITRGPDIGEIYFIGPTATGEGLYHSTNFGETAVCVDSINMVARICADRTIGSIYKIDHSTNMFYSDNYGQYGSWVFRTSEGSYSLASGRTEGEIFKGPGMSSNNYGFSFTQHSLNGCLCSIKTFEIGNQDSIGYILGDIYGIPDSLYLLISYDNFDNMEIQHIFDFNAPIVSLTRGYSEGKLYLYTYYWGIGDGRKLRFSNDYGETWELKNTFNCPNLPIKGIVGGRQPGELFMNIEYIQLMGQIKHTYIYHSLDYGATFEVYHPFSYGPPPYYANFEANPTNGTSPLTVQFTDLSSGNNIQTWEWDFDNDGIIDSYEQNPEYTYQDTGSYTVTLTIQYGPIVDTATRENYIYVTSGNYADEEMIEQVEMDLLNYPNPFNQITTISYELPINVKNAEIEIYNIKGQKVNKLTINIDQSIINWNGKNMDGNTLPSGIYFYKLNLQNSPIKKMLLIK